MPADDRTIHVLKQVDVKAANKNVVAKPERGREEEVGGGSRQMRKAESEIEAEGIQEEEKKKEDQRKKQKEQANKRLARTLLPLLCSALVPGSSPSFWRIPFNRLLPKSTRSIGRP